MEHKENLIFVAKSVLVALLGAITGSALGTAVGRLSGASGIVVSGAGFWVLKTMPNKDLLGYFLISNGVGMIASPQVTITPSEVKGLTGLEGFKEDAIGSLKMSLANVGTKFFLDKTPLAKFLPSTVSGLGELMGELGSLGNSDTMKAQAVLEQMILANQDKTVNGTIHDEFGGTIDAEFAIKGLGDIDEELQGILGEADSDYAEMGAIIRRHNGVLYPLNIPKGVEVELENKYGRAKLMNFRHKTNEGASAIAKQRVSKHQVNGIEEAYPMLSGTINSDY